MAFVIGKSKNAILDAAWARLRAAEKKKPEPAAPAPQPRAVLATAEAKATKHVPKKKAAAKKARTK